jgi:transcriptional regulator GlxA family with amidase domain
LNHSIKFTRRLTPIEQHALITIFVVPQALVGGGRLFRLQPDFSLQHIAEQSGLRASQLSTRFQTAYGRSPIQFATSVRLAKAAKLLVETDLTLDAVAELCGYQNAFYFSRVFSKQMRISPSVFRRTNRV